MSIAEVFLMLWAIVATVLAVISHNMFKRAVMHGKAISVLIAEVSLGEVKPKDDGDGFISVENEDIRMSFKKLNVRREP